MSGNFRDAFRKFIIHLIDRFRLRVFGSRSYHAFFHGHFADADAVICFIGNGFGNNIRSAVYRIGCRAHALFFVDKCKGFFFERLSCHLQPDNISKRLQSLFFCNGGPCPALRPVRPVQVIDHNECLGGFYLGFQFRGQFSLLPDAGNDLLLFIFQVPQVAQPFRKLAQYLVV